MRKRIAHAIDIENLKKLMERKGFSEEELAKRTGSKLTLIKRLLSGADQSKLSSYVLLNLSKVLEVAPSELLYEEYR